MPSQNLLSISREEKTRVCLLIKIKQEESKRRVQGDSKGPDFTEKGQTAKAWILRLRSRRKSEEAADTC